MGKTRDPLRLPKLILPSGRVARPIATPADRLAPGRPLSYSRAMAHSDDPGAQATLDGTTAEGSACVGWRPWARVPMLTVVHHPDAGRIGERAALAGLLPKGRATVSRLDLGFGPAGAAPSSRQPLADRSLSRTPLVLEASGTGGIFLRGRRPVDVQVAGVAPPDPTTVSAQDLESGVALQLSRRVVLLLHLGVDDPDLIGERLGLVGESPALQMVRQSVQRVADLDVPVLIRGETGTGKELVARAIHDASRRSGRPWVSVNMGAIASSVAVAELFGHVKGAFTGAVRDSEGYFGRAHDGTLFLDEIAEASNDVQAMLLRVLENGEIQPVGARSSRCVDLRLLAATDADLDEAIREGRFREPLLHRVAGFEIHVPALRERREDIPRLFLHFLRAELARLGESDRLASSTGPWLPAELSLKVVGHDWSGNVRQLRNFARQIAISNRGSSRFVVGPNAQRLMEDDRRNPADARAEGEAPRQMPDPARSRARRRNLDEIDDDDMVAALEANEWAVRPAAVALGIAPNSLYKLMERSPAIRFAGEICSIHKEALFAEFSRGSVVRIRPHLIGRCVGKIHGGSIRAEGDAVSHLQSVMDKLTCHIGINAPAGACGLPGVCETHAGSNQPSLTITAAVVHAVIAAIRFYVENLLQFAGLGLPAIEAMFGCEQKTTGFAQGKTPDAHRQGVACIRFTRGIETVHTPTLDIGPPEYLIMFIPDRTFSELSLGIHNACNF